MISKRVLGHIHKVIPKTGMIFDDFEQEGVHHQIAHRRYRSSVMGEEQLHSKVFIFF
ncbi:hypothetical protein H6G97_43125 [Nostoc flagelliforme FACHB-838]|uniref:Uncharacterized protein n=1 Tax=Nostoc flagelliforme FACHB-838 TaxID=2692904 RepID=A0ABR8E303_9NOSO|nr:hypothetical protein [Nostoc flagelliforme]MBD2535788.1 hypothetical protein [Nostoc flagelliforme FACHB-838]